MQTMPIRKLYYSISDVSQLADIKQHVLRYWETEFAELNPSKNRAGNRIYRLKEVKLVFLIKKLLYQEKYTLEGARQKLKQILKNDEELENAIDLKDEIKILVGEIKEDVEEIHNILFDRGVAQSG
jgi:DNA-binding transcriptional MerR regulator